MQTFTIDAERVQKTIVSIEADSREAITDKMIAAKLDRLPGSEWRTVDYGVLVIPAKGAKTLPARAAEIGISLPTLNRWKAQGTNVFDDEAIRERIAKRRNHSFKIAPKFQPRLRD